EWVAQGPRVDVQEKGGHARDEPDYAEDQPDEGKGPAAERASAGRDSLPGDETHDRRRRAQDDAQAHNGADDRDDADDQRSDSEPVGPLSRVSHCRRRVAARRWRHEASSRRWRRCETPARWRWRDIASAGGRRRRVEASARRW